MKKKALALLLALSLLSSLPALALDQEEGIPVLKDIVEAHLNAEEYRYEYDAQSQRFKLEFSLDSSLGSANAYIFLYNDMLSVSAFLPISVPQENREKMAILMILINKELYYSQLRMDFEDGEASIRSWQLIESVLPGEAEVDVLLSQPLLDLDAYGDALAKVALTGTDPYEAYQEARAKLR